MSRVGVIDYGMGNLDSVARALEECGAEPLVTDREEDLKQVDRMVLPGVGAFPDGMRHIRERQLDRILKEQVFDQRVPILGICLGMQLFATKGWEVRETSGLGWISGEVRRLEPHAEDRRIPHVGWNEVHCVRESPLFQGVRLGCDFYFAHSYHLIPSDPAVVVARTPYAGGFVSAVQCGRVFGVQFHPEKSQRAGFQVLRNFLAFRES